MKSIYRATYGILASSGVYTGTAMSRSPRRAAETAASRCWDALCAGDAKVGACSGIAVEWTRLRLGEKLVGRTDSY